MSELPSRLLIVCPYYFPTMVGGAEHTIRSLARGAARVSVATRVVCYAVGKTTSGVIEGVDVRRVPMRRQYNPATGEGRTWWRASSATILESLQRDQNILSEARDFNPSCILVHNRTLIGAATIDRLSRIAPTFLFLHDLGYSCARSTMRRRERNCEGLCADCALVHRASLRAERGLRGVLANSHFLLDRYRQLGLFQRMPAYIPNTPIDEAARSPCPSSGVRVVGYLGRIAPEKGIDVLIRSAKLLPGVNLKIAGTGAPGFTAYLQNLAQSEAPGRVEFLGHVPTSQLLQSVSVLAVPSLWHEPLGRVAIEAQMAGVPVVASRVGGLTEIVGQNDERGLGVEPGDPECLANAIERCLDWVSAQPRIDAGLQFAETCLSERFVANTLSFLGNALAEGRAHLRTAAAAK